MPSYYAGPQGLPLVTHANSDSYGMNIKTEGYSSLEGLIGMTSNAACCLDPASFPQLDSKQYPGLWQTTGLMQHVAYFSKTQR